MDIFNYLFSSTTSPNLVNHLLSSSGSVPVTSAILLLGFWSYLSIPLESPLTSVYIISMLQRTWCFASTKPSLIWSGPTGLTWSPRNMAPSKQILPRDNSLSLSLSLSLSHTTELNKILSLKHTTITGQRKSPYSILLNFIVCFS